jgi:AraC family transcriptional regulator
MNVSAVTLPDFHVACMRSVGPYGPTQIPALWTKLFGWAQARGLVTPDVVSLGISYDDPNITPPEKCRYDACIVVPSGLVPSGLVPPDLSPDPEITVKDVPGGKYAVSKYVGTAAEIGKAWGQMLSTWLPSSGYQMDERDCFELYRGRFYLDQAKGIFECDICVPVKPL